MGEGASVGTARGQLERLAVSTDVVHGVAPIATWLPLPEESRSTGVA